MKAAALATLAAFALSGCFGSSPEVTSSGRGLPEVTVSFPESVAGGTTETASLQVSNPGPGDIEAMIVAFTLVGAAGGHRLPAPLVPATFDRGERAITLVVPEPEAISRDGSTYRFGPLPVGDTITIEFHIRVSTSPGVAANSVTVSDVQDAERARGVLLQTTIEG